MEILNTKTSTTKQTILTLIKKSINSQTSTTSDEPYMIDNDYVLMPLFVGLFVALLLLWMRYRYTAVSEQRSHIEGSFSICPQNFFDFLAKCFKCK